MFHYAFFSLLKLRSYRSGTLFSRLVLVLLLFLLFFNLNLSLVPIELSLENSLFVRLLFPLHRK